MKTLRSEEKMEWEIDRQIGATAEEMWRLHWFVVVKKEQSMKAKLSIQVQQLQVQQLVSSVSRLLLKRGDTTN